MVFWVLVSVLAEPREVIRAIGPRSRPVGLPLASEAAPPSPALPPPVPSARARRHGLGLIGAIFTEVTSPDW